MKFGDGTYLNTNPHYYLTMEVCMDELIKLRASSLDQDTGTFGLHVR